MRDTVDKETLVSLLVEILILGLFRDKIPELVNVDGVAVSSVFVLSEDSDTFLTIVSWVIFEHIDSLMVFTSGITSSGWMLSMFSYSTVTH